MTFNWKTGSQLKNVIMKAAQQKTVMQKILCKMMILFLTFNQKYHTLES